MRARRLWGFLIAASGAASAGAAEVTPLPPPAGAGVERGVVLVRCATPTKGVFWNSRAAVLDVEAPSTADVLWSTAHGLPRDTETVKRDCRVFVRGKAHPIVDVGRAGGDQSGPEHDWAVLRTRRIPGDVYRWRVARATDDWLARAVADAASVRLVLRTADAPHTDCRLEPKTLEYPLLLTHSCLTHPGMSGAPLVIALDSEPAPVLLAVHVGSQVRWIGTKLDFASVARPLDADIEAAIDAAVTRAREASAR